MASEKPLLFCSEKHIPLVDLSFSLCFIYLFFKFVLVLHVAAHLVNALNFSENYNEDFLAINAANYRGEVSQLSFYILIFKCIIQIFECWYI